MKINTSEFIISAVKPEQYPIDNRVEIAFAGRSNAGKSSLINTVCNRRKLAKTSGTPGKTRLINFFLINGEFYFVDLPGYGFAKVAKTEKDKWGKMIEQYLTIREPLKKIVLLIDSRRKPTEDDVAMYNWIKYYGYEAIIIGTKCDKLKRSEYKKSEKQIKETLMINSEDKFLFFSSLKKTGVEEFLSMLDEAIE
jgi:GTP-binding protein